MLNVTITDTAAEIIKETLEDNEFANGYLEIAVIGGGCSGLKYQIQIIVFLPPFYSKICNQ
jgi:Fe-S cluster assembly iron-binding protein IscA